jgi:hypothetical protein
LFFNISGDWLAGAKIFNHRHAKSILFFVGGMPMDWANFNQDTRDDANSEYGDDSQQILCGPIDVRTRLHLLHSLYRYDVQVGLRSVLHRQDAVAWSKAIHESCQRRKKLLSR